MIKLGLSFHSNSQSIGKFVVQNRFGRSPDGQNTFFKESHIDIKKSNCLIKKIYKLGDDLLAKFNDKYQVLFDNNVFCLFRKQFFCL